MSVVSLQISPPLHGSPVELQAATALQNSVPLQNRPSSGQYASLATLSHESVLSLQESSVQPTPSSEAGDLREIAPSCTGSPATSAAADFYSTVSEEHKVQAQWVIEAITVGQSGGTTDAQVTPEPGICKNRKVG